MHLKALLRKLSALSKMRTSLEPTQKEDFHQTANKILSMIEPMKAGTLAISSRHERILQIEAVTNNYLGAITLGEGTQESAKAAVGYYEKDRDINKTLGDSYVIAVVELNIAVAKSKCGEGSNLSIEEWLKLDQDVYTSSVKHCGEDSI